MICMSPYPMQNLPDFIVDGQSTKLHTSLMGGHNVPLFVDGHTQSCTLLMRRAESCIPCWWEGRKVHTLLMCCHKAAHFIHGEGTKLLTLFMGRITISYGLLMGKAQSCTLLRWGGHTLLMRRQKGAHFVDMRAQSCTLYWQEKLHTFFYGKCTKLHTLLIGREQSCTLCWWEGTKLHTL